MESKKRCIIIYTEGETEEEFYDLVLEKIKEEYGADKFNVNKIIKKCLKGICKFDKKLLRKFEHEIFPKYKDYEIVVFLCYDADVFECSAKPPVDCSKLEQKLIELGANKVIHLKAEKCIEDLFLIDLVSICKYLGIDKIDRINGKNGVEKMKKLFSKGNRIYLKGYSCIGFVKALDMNKILENRKQMFKLLVDEIISSDNK